MRDLADEAAALDALLSSISTDDWLQGHTRRRVGRSRRDRITGAGPGAADVLKHVQAYL